MRLLSKIWIYLRGDYWEKTGFVLNENCIYVCYARTLVGSCLIIIIIIVVVVAVVVVVVVLR